MLGFQDETWWTRLAQPNVSAWKPDGEPLRLHQNEKGEGKQAYACYGIYRQDTLDMMIRFVEGRPVSQVTEDFLDWATTVLAKEGKRVLVLIWDNATWHSSKRVNAWIEAHNKVAEQEGGCAIRVCFLPVKAPWLNSIEPKWMHGKKAVAQPDRKLTAEELKARVCQYYDCEAEPDLKQVS